MAMVSVISVLPKGRSYGTETRHSFLFLLYLSLSAFLSVHVSQPYKATGHTKHFTSFFLRSLLNFLIRSSFNLVNAVFAIPILSVIADKLLPSLVNTDPKYLN